MISILLASHGNLASGLVNSMEMIGGVFDNVLTISLCEKGIEEFRNRLRGKIKELMRQGNKILIFVDLKGGTPFNEAYQMKLEHPEEIEIISGMNLPMVLECSMMSQETATIKDIVAKGISIGIEAIEKIDVDKEILEDDIEF